MRAGSGTPPAATPSFSASPTSNRMTRQGVAQRCANRNLAPPPLSTHQQETGDVGSGNQQQYHRAARQHQEARTNILRLALLPEVHAGCPVPIVWNRADGAACLIESDTITQSCEKRESSHLPILAHGCARQRNEHLKRAVVHPEIRRHDANHGSWWRIRSRSAPAAPRARCG